MGLTDEEMWMLRELHENVKMIFAYAENNYPDVSDARTEKEADEAVTYRMFVEKTVCILQSTPFTDAYTLLKEYKKQLDHSIHKARHPRTRQILVIGRDVCTDMMAVV